MANETLEQLGNALEAAQQKIGAVAEEVSEQAYNELVAIRREKLRGLQEAGNDPFELTSYPGFCRRGERELCGRARG